MRLSVGAVAVETGNFRYFDTRTDRIDARHILASGALPPGLPPVEIDGERVWPEEESPFPAPVIRTIDPDRPFRLSYGSCRTSEVNDLAAHKSHGVDSLLAFALHLADRGEQAAPDLIAFLGDQVYADLPSSEMRQIIRNDRGISTKLDAELRNYEEYTQIYRLAWSGPAIRWLLSTVPSAMIFDDHDIRDDWNSSLLWKKKVATIP